MYQFGAAKSTGRLILLFSAARSTADKTLSDAVELTPELIRKILEETFPKPNGWCWIRSQDISKIRIIISMSWYPSKKKRLFFNSKRKRERKEHEETM